MNLCKSIIIEQFCVLFILIIHLSGFSGVSRVPSEIENAEKNDLENFIQNSKHYNVERIAKKVILIVIDALRTDHLASDKEKKMKYSHDLLQKGQAVSYQLRTASPTVTLPRIKSFVTGSVSSFIDIILNFASGEISEDNIIDAAQKKGIYTAFYGDETWLKLYPKTFQEWEGVTSFFVSDFTEVDNNVTRHLPRLMSEDKWELLILHYLGLDHIGHLEGPKSKLILPKLMEMDSIIKSIHQNLTKKGESYLLLICGDHGMSNRGGHGGASHSEIWTSGLVVSHLTDRGIRHHLDNSSLEKAHNQVDLASTLAIYLGIEVPRKNIGVPLYDLLVDLPLQQQLIAHFRVSKQLMRLMQSTLEKFDAENLSVLYEKALSLHKDIWQKDREAPEIPKKILNLYKQFELQISSALTDNLKTYDLPVLLASSTALMMISVPTIIWTLFLNTELKSPVYVWRLVLVTACGFVGLRICSWLGLTVVPSHTFFLAVLLAFGFYNVMSFVKCFTAPFIIKVSARSAVELCFIIGLVSLPFSLLATSMVEEEHFGFYFVVSLTYSLLLWKIIRSYICSFYASPEHIFDSGSSTTKLSGPAFLPAFFDADVWLHAWIERRQKTNHLLYSGFRKGLFASKFCILLASFLLFRLLRAFNSTGDKWKHLIRLNDLLRVRPNQMQIIVIFSLLVAIYVFKKPFGKLFLYIAAFGIFGRHYPILYSSALYKNLAPHSVYVALLIFFIYCCVRVISYKHDEQLQPKKLHFELCELVIYFLQILETVVAFLLLLLQQPENIPVITLGFVHIHLILPMLMKNFCILGIKRAHVYVFAFWIAQSHFFVQGNSNSLSSVQVNAGFVGVTSYHPFLHGTLIAVNTFGAKFLVLVHTLIVSLCCDKNVERFTACLQCWWMMQLLTLTVYILNVTLQRYHLFIWSVFAPKMLYEECHFLLLLTLSLIVLGSWNLAKFAYWSSARGQSSRYNLTPLAQN